MRRSGGGNNARRGRGTGGQRPNSAPRSAPSNKQSSSSRHAASQPRNTIKQNGEKGAEAFTVSENDRIRLTKILMHLRESDEISITFPPNLTNTERKFVHQLSMQLGLVSKSYGKGEQRCITVSKQKKKVKKTTGGHDEDDKEEFPALNVGRRGALALEKHIMKFPPTETERMESYETGSSLTQQNSNKDGMLKNTLDELGLGKVKDSGTHKVPTVKVDMEQRRRQHAIAQKRKVKHPNYQNMQQVRSKLPAHGYAQEVCSIIHQNQVTVLSGETGCGKSTQVPQFLLDNDAEASIVVTQPRRISAISVAERVAAEQCLEPVGGMVGYQVRLESASSQQTQLMFLTPGVLLRKLQSSPLLMEYNYIVVDEIHERDKYTEFLLIALRDILPRRPDLRVVLMSATLQTNELVEYWYGFGKDGGPPAEINIPGRTFAVQEFFLEDVLSMTNFLNKQGGGDMDQLEAEMAKLLAQKQPKLPKEQQRGRRNNKSQQNNPTILGDGTSLVCVMCNKSGFSSAEELGTHVALCDGGGGVTMDQLEERVRGISVSDVACYDADGKAAATFEDYDELDEAEFEDYDEEFDDDDDEIPGLTHGKWDGQSPFVVGDVVSGNITTLTEEEMLSQYQSLHDDEQIDDVLLLEVVRLIVQSSYGDGAILIFFPGWQEISEFSLLLESTPPFQDRTKYIVLPLHSGIPSKDQRKVFQRPPGNARKIILSTNIAETSVTIDDVSFVVDTGRAKEKNYDPHLKTSTLQPVWISQASAKQRKGRAGRTKPGVCFHLFSRRRHSSFREFIESELLRTPLEEMCLQCKKLELAPGGPEDIDGVPAFLAKALSPPHPKSVSNALDLLVELGAMEPETNELTSLGRCLSVLSLEPRVGKMVIWSHLLGCARAASCMAVAMSYKSPFILPPPSMRRAADSAKVELSRNTESDQVTILYALRKRDQFFQQNRHGAYYEFCRRNFLSTTTLQMIADLRKNLSRELTSLGFPNTTALEGYHNRHERESDLALWQSAIVAGLYPNVAFRKRGEMNFSTTTNRKAKIHVSSVNSVRGQPLNSKCQVKEGEVEFVAFGEMVRGVASFTMSQTTHLASALPLVLLCGNSLRVRPAANDDAPSPMSVLSVDDWIVFSCHTEIASGLVILRMRLESAFLRITARPSAGMSHLSSAERDAIETLGSVIQSAHRMTPDR